MPVSSTSGLHAALHVWYRLRADVVVAERVLRRESAAAISPIMLEAVLLTIAEAAHIVGSAGMINQLTGESQTFEIAWRHGEPTYLCRMRPPCCSWW